MNFFDLVTKTKPSTTTQKTAKPSTKDRPKRKTTTEPKKSSDSVSISRLKDLEAKVDILYQTILQMKDAIIQRDDQPPGVSMLRG